MYHILVVDDESRIRSILRKYAEFEGFTVSEAGDGMEAVQICRSESFDLVIMDIMMPELDGFSACREIRKFSDVPIIMLSARGEEYDKINGFAFGIDDYVVKPFSPKELMLRVAAVLKRTKMPRPADAERPQNKIVELDGGGLRADVTARIVRPVKELKGYTKVELQPGQTKRVTLTLNKNDMGFYVDSGEYVLEDGLFRIFVGGNSVQCLMKEIEISFAG
jgi:DNA-binding response OmpR family regulator